MLSPSTSVEVDDLPVDPDVVGGLHLELLLGADVEGAFAAQLDRLLGADLEGLALDRDGLGRLEGDLRALDLEHRAVLGELDAQLEETAGIAELENLLDVAGDGEGAAGGEVHGA